MERRMQKLMPPYKKFHPLPAGYAEHYGPLPPLFLRNLFEKKTFRLGNNESCAVTPMPRIWIISAPGFCVVGKGRRWGCCCPNFCHCLDPNHLFARSRTETKKLRVWDVFNSLVLFHFLNNTLFRRSLGNVCKAW